MSHLGHRKPARIHWKAGALNTSHCLVQILLQRHNWATFLRGSYSQWRSLSGPVERIFVHQKLKRRILATFGFNRTAVCATQSKLHSMFCELFRIISRRADVVYPLRSCEYYLWGSVNDKCYADKPETIDALKNNICEVAVV